LDHVSVRVVVRRLDQNDSERAFGQVPSKPEVHTVA
jgi:hypothetical protein